MEGLETANVLIVDDRLDNLTVLEAVLDLPSTHIVKARSGTEALTLAAVHDFAVILLDVQMPGMDGFETARRLRVLKSSRDVPIIFVTAIYGDDAYIHEGYAVGAVDYIFKPYNPYILRSKVSIFVDLYRKNRQLLKQEEMLRESESRERSRQMALLELRSLQREREVQQKYRDLVDSIEHCIVWSADPESLRFTFVSNRAEKLTGYSLREWLEEPDFLLKHLDGEDLNRVLHHLHGAEEGKDATFEHRIVDSKDNTMWFHTSVRLVRKSRGLGLELRGLSVDITLAKQSQEKLRQAQERLSRVVQTSPILLVGTNSLGTVILAEGKGLEAMGVKSSDLVGQSVYKMYGQNQEVIEGFKSALSGHEGRLEIRFGNICYEIYFSPQRNDDNEICGVVAVAHDITDRKRSETERQKLISLVENTSDFVFVASPDQKLSYANKSAQQMVGLSSPGEHKIFDFLDEADSPLIEQEILPLVLREGTWTGEIKFRHLSVGCPISTAVNILSIRDSETRDFIALACIGRDITERKRRENEQHFLAEVGACLANFLDSESTLARVADLVVSQYAEFCFIRLLQDDGSLKLAAVTHADPEKVHYFSLLDQNNPVSSSSGTDIGQILRSKKSTVYVNPSETELQTLAHSPERAEFFKGMGFNTYLRVPMVIGGRAIGVICVCFSATEMMPGMVELFEELGRRVASAVENSRLYQNAERAIHTRDEFLSIASHELKTPLTPLKLQFQTVARLARDGKLSTLPQEKIEKMFDRSDRQILRITNLIEDLLSVSRINLGRITLDLRPTDLGKLVSEVIEQFRDQLIDARCELNLDLENGVSGRWDPFRLEQVIANLLTNAIKYGPGSPIDVKTRQNGQYAVISIVDHGIGIADADHGRIFDLFERAVPSRHYGGLGLGLYIVRNIVEAHGGTVAVKSQPGLGATFVVTLPLVTVTPLKKMRKLGNASMGEEEMRLH